MARPICIFCVHPAKSGEHLWSKWMRPLLGEGMYRGRMESAVDFARKSSPFGEFGHRHRNGAPEHTRIEVVCAICNNGWMNTIEKAARPYLTPLIKGEPTTLDTKACTAIAEWVFLKVLVLAHAPNPVPKHTPHFIYTRSERLAFKMSRKVPHDFRIWLGRGSLSRWRVGVRLGSGNLHVGAASPDRPMPPQRPVRNLQTVIWGIGGLVVHTFAMVNPDVGVEWPPLPKGVPIWPPPKHTIVWPPSRALSDTDMDAVAATFGDLMQRIPRIPRT